MDIQTGEVIARKEFDPASTPAGTTDPTLVGYDPLQPERSMHYAFAATPGVYDVDDDGYADVVYAPDLGGNVWKWDIQDIGHDSVNSSSTDYDQNTDWSFSLFFQAPTYLDSAGTGERYWKSFFFHPSAVEKGGNLWLALGSGQRMNLKWPGIAGVTLDNDRFYSIVDTDWQNLMGVPATLAETDLLDVTGNAVCADVSAYKGFFLEAAEGEKFVTETDIFFYVAFAASYIPR